MQIDIFTLCESSHNYNGKIIIVGTFNQINSNQFPFVYNSSFSVVGRIGYDKEGKKDYKLSFLSPEGKNVIEPLKWQADVKNTNNRIEYVDFQLTFNQIEFMLPGTYLFKLESEGIERVLKLYITKNDNAN